jgi:hypothetical protein
MLRKMFHKALIPTLIVLGLALRLRQYFAGRSLWLDEAMLALNIVGRSFAGLLQPLDYDQGAPLGFLLLEKLAATLGGDSELSLRLLPLLTGCASLILFALLLRQITQKAGMFTALTLFAAGAPLVYYASEVKQYSSDVFVALLLFWLAGEILIHEGHEGTQRKTQKNSLFFFVPLRVLSPPWMVGQGGKMLFLAIAGTIAIWFSHPALFVLSAIGATLLLHYWLQKEMMHLKQMALVIVAWGVSFIILYFVNLRGLASNQFMLHYWAGAFMPLPPWVDWNWFPAALKNLIDNPVGLGTSWVLPALLMLTGLVALLRRHWQFGAFFGLTLLAALAASALGKYPFAGRMILFAVPVFLALLGAGLDAVVGWFQRPRWLGNVIALALAVILLYDPITSAAQNFVSPKYNEHIRPTMAYLQANRKADDILYVYSWAVPAVRYYARFYGLQENDFTAGGKHENDPQGLLTEIDRLKGGKRVWVLFSHVYEQGNFNEKDFILAHLDEIGQRKREFREPGTSVDLVLYDLSK